MLMKGKSYVKTRKKQIVSQKLLVSTPLNNTNVSTKQIPSCSSSVCECAFS